MAIPRMLLILGSILLTATPAIAGRNANGAMIVHTNDSYTYSAATVCSATAGDPGTCEAAVTSAGKASGQVVWFLARFLPTSSPCVTVVYFGIDYDDACLDPGVAYKFCGPAGSLEVPDGDWPYAGRGNSVAFGSPICGDTLFPFYVFKIDNFCSPDPGAWFCTAVNPTGGYAGFVDDTDPPVLDYCFNFGCIHWFENGYNSCVGDEGGACCFPDGGCLQMLQMGCLEAGGEFLGNGVPCEPNPCEQPSACCFPDCHCELLSPELCFQMGGTPMGPGTGCDPNPCSCPPGACCYPDGHCEYTPQGLCDGVFQGIGVPCDPNPCPPTPTEGATWGQIKASYR